ncbi:tyrosine-type recombinase/integrase [Paramicrobacterium chengjingii]|uniref:tyrosine-type recombinase/integrase n=1 Tax=Paramicrobacterium chengjingii TaxID=2769067 RepID=UPI001422738C|nr:site-specific integrase [Microbacterium chengjingii]
MPRPPLPLETWGKIRRTTVDGKQTAIAYYRDSDGHTRPMQRQGKTAADAERRLVKALRDRLAPTTEYLTRESTLQELASQWMVEINGSKRATSTKRRYQAAIDAHVNKAVGAVRIREATVPRMQRFVDAVAKNAGDGQARMMGVVITGMFGLAVRYGAADSNAGKDLLLPSVEREAVRAPSIDDVHTLRTIFAAYDAKPAARGNSVRDLAGIIDMLLATGARIGEVLALRWSKDVDLGMDKVSITGTVVYEKGKGVYRQEIPKSDESNRVLTLPTFAVDMLTRRRVDSYCDWVFPSATGKLRYPENVRQQWGVAVKGSTVEWMTTKSCRKAVATVIRNSEGLKAASEQLGHAGEGVTSKHYVERNLERRDMSQHLDVFVENSE